MMNETCSFLNEIESDHEQSANCHEIVITDYQIIRINKTQSGQKYRSVIDTIRVKNGMIEIALKRAVAKAQNIGNCYVLELAEKLVSGI